MEKEGGKRRKEYVIASENALFTSLGFKTVRNVLPGEAIFIDNDGNLHSQQCFDKVKNSPCIFEYVYLARPDSTIDEVSVYKSRMRMGLKLLASKIRKLNIDKDIDVVIPIPEQAQQQQPTTCCRLKKTL